MKNRLITENQLDEWVRGNSRDAQAVIVELVYRLVAASCPRPKERRFPLGDSIGQHGPDGFLETAVGFAPFVPDGRSFWEVGTGLDAGGKATTDYNSLTESTPQDIRHDSSFVFVTPLSGRRDWEFSWKPEAQLSWLEERRRRGEWRSVTVIDGSRLIDWLQPFPAVEAWLGTAVGLPAHEMQTPERRWAELRPIGEPPPLTPAVFLANREAACAKLQEILAGNVLQLKIETHFLDQVPDFVCAYVSGMADDLRTEAVGRCLVIGGSAAWNTVCSLRDRHVLIADFDLDENETLSEQLLQRARNAGHVVVYGSLPGGIPHPNRVSLPNPRSYQISEALTSAGYPAERARTLAQKSGGNLRTLLRCLQNLSLMPEWAQGTPAAELVVAEVLGGWQESSEPDRAVVEKLSGKGYGEWIGTMREIARRPGTPLTVRDGQWKAGSRYEAWYALGPLLFDEHLDRLREVATVVLRERDPKFDLPAEERYLAPIRGMVLAHSASLRRGLAESLTLVGSHASALRSCSQGKAEAVAILAVREILAGADWILWASLNDVLPLLAEAAPNEFLDIVEKALGEHPSPLVGLFAQERSPLTGSNYMTGLLWALETLAWSQDHLTRVLLILGELADQDPGGQWGNRPAHSLTTILLPWLPQTCAPVEKRSQAIIALLREIPGIGWKTLLSLLPRAHQVSGYNRKPAWRELIPDDWSEGVTRGEYREQTSIYTDLAIEGARTNRSRLASLVDRLDDLPQPAQEKILGHLSSDVITSLPEVDRLDLWMKLVSLVARHRKFATAEWALAPERVDEIATVASRLAPTSPSLRHMRIFSERVELYDAQGDYERQRQELDQRRQEAVAEVLGTGGVQAVVAFAESVESPWRVGFALGMIGDGDVDRAMLPSLLGTEIAARSQFVGSFVRARFHTQGWQWVDQLRAHDWTSEETAQLLAYLPFAPPTWERVTQWLPAGEAPYWAKTNANQYEAEGQGLEFAIDRLLEYGRPRAAIGSLMAILQAKQALNSQQAIRALLASVTSAERPGQMDTYEAVQVIKALQDNPNTDPHGLFQVEWAYLPLLEDRQGAAATLLERRLSEEPDFFCEVVRLVFHPRSDEARPKPTEEQTRIATNAYRLLHAWRITPGTRKDGSYDGAALATWLERAKALCAESGHLEIAMTMVGHVFAYAPADPGGLWIHQSAAEALNARDAGDMRDGFRTELFNSRGVHGFTAGKEEADLATKYRSMADQVEASGYHRLATGLRELATSYDRYSDHEASRDPYDE